MAYGTNKKKKLPKSISKKIAEELGKQGPQAIRQNLMNRMSGSPAMSKKENTTEIRTRTKVRKGGAVVKTKTVTKGDGMKKVEKTKIKNDAFGPYAQKSVYEKGPMGKSAMFEYRGTTPEGEKYGYSIQRTKAGGVKKKMEGLYDDIGTQSKYKEKGKGYKTKTVKVTETGGRNYIKKKGRGTKMELMSKPIKNR